MNPTIQCTRHCSQFISPLRNDYTKDKCKGCIKCRDTWFNKVNVVKQWLLGCVTIPFNIWFITNIWFLPVIWLHFKIIKGNVLDDISSSSIFDLLAIACDMVFLKCGTFNFHGFGDSIFCKFNVQIIVAQVHIQVDHIPMAKAIKSTISVLWSHGHSQQTYVIGHTKEKDIYIQITTLIKL